MIVTLADVPPTVRISPKPIQDICLKFGLQVFILLNFNGE
jgi:hypothetical protein